MEDFLDLLPFVDSENSVSEPRLLKFADLNLLDVSKKDKKIFSIAPVAKRFLDVAYKFDKLQKDQALRYARNNYRLYQQISGASKGDLFQKCVEYILEISHDDRQMFYHDPRKRYTSFLIQDIQNRNNFFFVPTNKTFPCCDYIHFNNKIKKKKKKIAVKS